MGNAKSLPLGLNWSTSCKQVGFTQKRTFIMATYSCLQGTWSRWNRCAYCRHAMEVFLGQNHWGHCTPLCRVNNQGHWLPLKYNLYVVFSHGFAPLCVVKRKHLSSTHVVARERNYGRQRLFMHLSTPRAFVYPSCICLPLVQCNWLVYNWLVCRFLWYHAHVYNYKPRTYTHMHMHACTCVSAHARTHPL